MWYVIFATKNIIRHIQSYHEQYPCTPFTSKELLVRNRIAEIVVDEDGYEASLGTFSTSLCKASDKSSSPSENLFSRSSFTLADLLEAKGGVANIIKVFVHPNNFFNFKVQNCHRQERPQEGLLQGHLINLLTTQGDSEHDVSADILHSHHVASEVSEDDIEDVGENDIDHFCWLEVSKDDNEFVDEDDNDHFKKI